MEYDAFAGKWATTEGLLSENHGFEPQRVVGEGGECAQAEEVKQLGLDGESGIGR